MNMQIFIAPAATVAAVCLAAYFALRNERKKKALEIRTTQLDRISELGKVRISGEILLG
ncbi:hypothetical protein MX598_15990 [Escherichia coli]|nr:hypothetical protein [Escherichia coli]